MISDCIFCKIVAGEIPSSKVYEDDYVLAFLDITQVTPGHTLVIPKQHCRTVLEMDSLTSSALGTVLPKISRHLVEQLSANGLNILNNSEEVAGQTVFHAHFHLLPRFSEEDGIHITFQTKQPNFSALNDLAQTLYLGDE